MIRTSKQLKDKVNHVLTSLQIAYVRISSFAAKSAKPS